MMELIEYNHTAAETCGKIELEAAYKAQAIALAVDSKLKNRAHRAWRWRILYIRAILDAMRYEYWLTHFSGTKEDYFQLTQFSGNFLTENAEAQRYFKELFVLYHNIENNGVNGSILAPVDGVKMLDALL